MKKEYLKKNKNLFIFYENEEDAQKPYVLDVNKGVCYGKRGQVLKNRPQALTSAIEYILSNTQDFDIDIVNMAFTLRSMTCPLFLSTADKLASLGYSLKSDFEDNEISKYIYFVDTHFKDFAKSYKNNPDLSFSQFVEDFPFQQWLLENNLEENDYISLDLLKVAYKIWHFSTETVEVKDLNVNLIIYYLTHGLYDYEEGSWHSIITKFFQYMFWCNTLHIKPKKDCFMRTYAEMKIIYKNFIEKDNDDLLKKYQKNHHLEFETEKYKVVVPVTKEDFIQETDNQNSCVFKRYYPQVLQNDTNIVFIRDKQNLEKSLITCEVKKGVIIQYSLRNNERVHDIELLEFKKLYQEYLQKNYQK